jgi:hypothetical protein
MLSATHDRLAATRAAAQHSLPMECQPTQAGQTSRTTMMPVSDTTNPAAVAQDNGSLGPSRQSAIGQFRADALVVALGWGANKME